MNTPSLAESIYALGEVSPKYEPTFIYTTLLQAVSAPQSVRFSSVKNAIIVAVERRLLGLIEDLAENKTWTLHQMALGENIQVQIVDTATTYLATLLLPTSSNPLQAHLNLGMAMTYLWALYDIAYDTLGELVHEQTDSGPLLHRPDPRDSDIA